MRYWLSFAEDVLSPRSIPHSISPSTPYFFIVFLDQMLLKTSKIIDVADVQHLAPTASAAEDSGHNLMLALEIPCFHRGDE